MDYAQDEQPEEDLETKEAGSDELLAADNLRLPESASMLVRLHAVRAWLLRRQEETSSERGEAALALQAEPHDVRLRRRAQLEQDELLQRIQHTLNEAQQRLDAYEEAQALLEECITHTTSGERVLVEYYLMLEEMVQTSGQKKSTPWLHAIADVQNRVEHVGMPQDYDA